MIPPKSPRLGANHDAGSTASKKLGPRNGERLRLGLTGLGAIFLLVMVVAAGLRPVSHPAAQDPKGESLAVLGVAPGAGSAAPVAPKP